MKSIHLLASLAFLGLLPAEDAPAPRPQDREREAERKLPEDLYENDALREEMIRAFHDVERKLIDITTRLADAGAGEAPVTEVGESGIDKLLRSSRQSSNDVVSGIEKILELAERMNTQTCMSGAMSGERPQSGESPLDQRRDRSPQDREATPEGPDPQREGEQREQGHERPGQDQPDSALPNPPDGENRPGSEQRPPQGEPSETSDDSEHWGNLPVRMRETFRNQGRNDLPVQYRDWIDSYYRRLNRKP
jgi:hypothetical protein